MKLRFSRKIINILYDPETLSLTIVFHSGIQKTYSGVHEDVYNKFNNAPDKNLFYVEKIEGQYAVL